MGMVMNTSDGAGGEVFGPMVFISYRRADTRDLSAALSVRLRDDLSARNVFRDEDDLILGQNWRDWIKDGIERSDSVLLLIGPGWAGDGSFGERRIDEQSDMVRVEAAMALRNGLDGKVLPVLVDIEKLPEKLPAELAALAEYHYVSDSRDALLDEQSAGYQKILVGVWASLLRKAPDRLLVLSENGLSLAVEAVVEELGLTSSSDARELSSFACGAQLLSIPELDAARERWPDVLVYSELPEPSGLLANRLKALEEHPAIRNVALVGSGAVVGTAGGAVAASKLSGTTTASTGTVTSTSVSGSVVAKVASILLVVGGVFGGGVWWAANDASNTISGHWRGDWGDLVIEEDGEEIRAAFSCCAVGGQILRRDSDDVFRGWFKDSVGTGQVEYRLLPSGGLDGRWRWGNSGTWSESWDVEPVVNESIPVALSERLDDDDFYADIWKGD